MDVTAMTSACQNNKILHLALLCNIFKKDKGVKMALGIFPSPFSCKKEQSQLVDRSKS